MPPPAMRTVMIRLCYQGRLGMGGCRGQLRKETSRAGTFKATVIPGRALARTRNLARQPLDSGSHANTRVLRCAIAQRGMTGVWRLGRLGLEMAEHDAARLVVHFGLEDELIAIARGAAGLAEISSTSRFTLENFANTSS